MIGVQYQDKEMYDYEGYFIIYENEVLHPKRVSVGGSGVNFFNSSGGVPRGRRFLKMCLEEFEQQIIPMKDKHLYAEYFL